MSPLEILIELKKLNIIPGIDGNQLKLTGDTNKLSSDLVAQVRPASRSCWIS
jgi:hypothetical protein